MLLSQVAIIALLAGSSLAAPLELVRRVFDFPQGAMDAIKAGPEFEKFLFLLEGKVLEDGSLFVRIQPSLGELQIAFGVARSAGPEAPHAAALLDWYEQGLRTIATDQEDDRARKAGEMLSRINIARAHPVVYNARVGDAVEDTAYSGVREGPATDTERTSASAGSSVQEHNSESSSVLKKIGTGLTVGLGAFGLGGLAAALVHNHGSASAVGQSGSAKQSLNDLE